MDATLFSVGAMVSTSALLGRTGDTLAMEEATRDLALPPSALWRSQGATTRDRQLLASAASC